MRRGGVVGWMILPILGGGDGRVVEISGHRASKFQEEWRAGASSASGMYHLPSVCPAIRICLFVLDGPLESDITVPQVAKRQTCRIPVSDGYLCITGQCRSLSLIGNSHHAEINLRGAMSLWTT